MHCCLPFLLFRFSAWLSSQDENSSLSIDCWQVWHFKARRSSLALDLRHVLHCWRPLFVTIPSPSEACCFRCHSEKSETPFLFPHCTHVQLPSVFVLHSRHTPLVRFCHKVLAHSPGSKSEDVFAEPHLLHTRRSFRAHSMQTRCFDLTTLFFVKSDSCFH